MLCFVTYRPFMLSVIMLSVIMLSVIMLSVIIVSVIVLSVIMLSVIVLSVIMLSVIMLSAVAPLLQLIPWLFALRMPGSYKLMCLSIANTFTFIT
jgi:hypothetical protein